VEAGAHDGRLAADILAWFRDHRPDLFARLEYCILEPSPRRRQWQAQTLAEFANRVRWVSNFSDLVVSHSALAPPSPLSPLPSSRLRRIFFSNELLDAMPVHRLARDPQAHTWFEWGVALNAGRFDWARMPPESPKSGPVDHASRITHHDPRPTIQQSNNPIIQRLAPLLPDSFILDLCPAAEQWWTQAAQSLPCGKLLTLDYGLTAEEFRAPHRKDGTLRAYRQHQLSPDLLANPGDQDLTAHVNFTALQAAGEAAGLTTESFQTQEQFLTRILDRIVKEESPFPSWTPSRTRQFQTLTHPDLMGRPFRVLVQSRA
jgi:SAM-dependent MidA family methyltransferase